MIVSDKEGNVPVILDILDDWLKHVLRPESKKTGFRWKPRVLEFTALAGHVRSGWKAVELFRKNGMPFPTHNAVMNFMSNHIEGDPLYVGLDEQRLQYFASLFPGT